MDLPSEAAEPAATSQRSPQPPNVVQMPQLPRLHTSPGQPGAVPSVTALGRSSHSLSATAVDLGDTQPPTDSPPAMVGAPLPHAQQQRPCNCSAAEVSGPFDVPEAASPPSSPPALLLPAAPDESGQYGSQSASRSHTPQRKADGLAAPAVLEMRTSDASADSQQQADQREESDGQSSLMDLLAAMVGGRWSPTHTPPSTQHVASESGCHSSQVLQGPVGVNAAGNGAVAPAASAVVPVGQPNSAHTQEVDAVETDASNSENPFADNRSTMADALPAEPDLAAAARSSFEHAGDRYAFERCMCVHELNPSSPALWGYAGYMRLRQQGRLPVGRGPGVACACSTWGHVRATASHTRSS